MKTYKVEFLSGITHDVFKVGQYHSKKAIRKAQDRYDNEYGAYLSLKISDETGKQCQIFEVA